jgi:hypothetical protein
MVGEARRAKLVRRSARRRALRRAGFREQRPEGIVLADDAGELRQRVLGRNRGLEVTLDLVEVDGETPLGHFTHGRPTFPTAMFGRVDGAARFPVDPPAGSGPFGRGSASASRPAP